MNLWKLNSIKYSKNIFERTYYYSMTKIISHFKRILENKKDSWFFKVENQLFI